MLKLKMVDFIYFHLISYLFYFPFIFLFLDLGLGISMMSYMTITTITHQVT